MYQSDGLNLYAYCGNNSVVYYDPSGYVQKKGCLTEKQEDGATTVEQTTKKTTGGEKQGSDTLPENIVQRGLTPSEAESIVAGNGIGTPKPPHKTPPTQHVGGTEHSRDPWTSTTRSSETAEYYATHDNQGNLLTTPNPIVEINLDAIDPKNIVDVFTPDNAQQLTTPFTRNAAADQEVLIYGDISMDAIIRIINLEYE